MLLPNVAAIRKDTHERITAVCPSESAESLINSDRQFSTVSSSLRNISHELPENYSFQRCIPVYVATRPNESEQMMNEASFFFRWPGNAR